METIFQNIYLIHVTVIFSLLCMHTLIYYTRGEKHVLSNSLKMHYR